MCSQVPGAPACSLQGCQKILRSGLGHLVWGFQVVPLGWGGHPLGPFRPPPRKRTRSRQPCPSRSFCSSLPKTGLPSITSKPRCGRRRGCRTGDSDQEPPGVCLRHSNPQGPRAGTVPTSQASPWHTWDTTQLLASPSPRQVARGSPPSQPPPEPTEHANSAVRGRGFTPRLSNPPRNHPSHHRIKPS